MNRPATLRLMAFAILLTLPLFLLVRSIQCAAQEGMFEDFGGQLKDLLKVLLTGKRVG